MSHAIPRQLIVTSALKGVRKAFRDYMKWSGGYWLSTAPESFIQSKIAEALSGTCPYVTLEDTVRDILTEANAEMRGRVPRRSPSGRVDIIVWWKNGKPRTLIEVKIAWTYDIITADARRLRQLVKRDSSIQSGLIVAYTEAKTPDTITTRFEGMARRSNTVVVERAGPNRPAGEGDWFWDAACFAVE